MIPASQRRPPEEFHTRPGRKLESVQEGDAVPQLEKGMGTFIESPRSIVAIATDAEPGPEMARLKRTDAADRPREKRPVTGLTFASEPWSVGCASSGMGPETSPINARLAPSAARVLRSGGGILMPWISSCLGEIGSVSFCRKLVQRLRGGNERDDPHLAAAGGAEEREHRCPVVRRGLHPRHPFRSPGASGTSRYALGRFSMKGRTTRSGCSAWAMGMDSESG